jgi:hypothetical protein
MFSLGEYRSGVVPVVEIGKVKGMRQQFLCLGLLSVHK